MKEINKEIEKTFNEMNELMRFLYSRFNSIISLLNKMSGEKKSSGLDSQTQIEVIEELKRLFDPETQKNFEIRVNHLFNKSKPPLNEEKRLHHGFLELQGILTKVVNGLPGLIDEKGEMNQKSLNLLTNFLATVEKLEKGQEEWVTISDGENSSYALVKLSEKERLENELARERAKNDILVRNLALLEAKEEEKDNQLKQLKEREQQAREEAESELESITNSIKPITNSITFPGELSPEELISYLAKLRDIKKLLITGTDEQKKVIGEEHGELKKSLGQLKLEERLRKQRDGTKQRIADALVDKGAVIPVKVKEEELPKRYRDYSESIDKMNNSSEINKFEREILQIIALQRKEYQTITEALLWGEKTISGGNVKQAEKARRYLLEYRKLQLKQKESSNDYNIFINNELSGKYHALIVKLQSFISESKETVDQIEQPTK